MKRIVVKIGTKVLSRDDGTLDYELLSHVVDQIVELRNQGIQLVLVTSGAVGAGKNLVNLDDIQSETVRKQVYASVGQVKLMSTYAELFSKYHYHCAQVLATKEDFRDDVHYSNMQNCFEGLLQDGIIPIVNENDVVATTELLFTDNDELAGLVAKQVQADSLIILTSTDGILDDTGKTILQVSPSTVDYVASYIKEDTSSSGRGGMISKFTTAKELLKLGITVHIVNGKKENVIVGVVDGKQLGTVFSL